MRRKNITTLIVMMLVAGAFLYAASGKMFVRFATTPEPKPLESTIEKTPPQQQKSTVDKRMVDMTADDSYLIEKGDSTIFILVGNFAAHHNGAVILADSAVRYSNQSFECFGNVLINQNTTYIYGERAEYNRNNNTAKVFSRLIKIVDEDALMYTYQCEFNTAKSEGVFTGGCYVEKEDNLLEAERGFYNTDTHELKAINRVQMRNNDYEVLSDSVIFNTQTEDAEYFTNTHIWNTNDEYLNTQAGTYTKSSDLHHLTRSSYILQPEREIWGDSIMYYRTDGHIIARRNIQLDDSTQKILGFADYAEWWDEPGNALFTRRPSMINYDPELTDSIYLSADTLWMYTIPVVPEPEKQDSVANDSIPSRSNEEMLESNSNLKSGEQPASDINKTEEQAELNGNDKEQEGADKMLNNRDTTNRETHKAETPSNEHDNKKSNPRGDEKSDTNTERKTNTERETNTERKTNTERENNLNKGEHSTDDTTSNSESKLENTSTSPSNVLDDTLPVADTQLIDTLSVADTLLVDTLQRDTTKYTAKQLRRRAKLERKAERDTIKAREQAVRDSLKAIEQAKLDSIQHIRDSLLKMKIDTIIAQRIERSSRIADEEKARIERIKIKVEKRRRHKIDKAKARALKRGKEYKGEDYDPNDTLFSDIVTPSRNQTDTTTLGKENDSIAGGIQDSTLIDSTMRDTLPLKKVIPADSVYKMIKAYRKVKMFREKSQMVCDSLVTLNTDSIIRMYQSPVMWNDNNQITSDSAWIHTKNQRIDKAHFMGTPIMGIEIDTAYYNQVKGKEMIAYFDGGQVYRNDVNGNAQTIYYLQEDAESEVTALMYIESSAITFYLDDGEMDKIAYKQNPEYVLYPMSMIPETQQRKLDGFSWVSNMRPTRDSICDRTIRISNRENVAQIRKPTFPIVERINYDRRRLVENRMWKDRNDRLTPDIIEWRNSCPSYKKRRK